MRIWFHPGQHQNLYSHPVDYQNFNITGIIASNMIPPHIIPTMDWNNIDKATAFVKFHRKCDYKFRSYFKGTSAEERVSYKIFMARQWRRQYFPDFLHGLTRKMISTIQRKYQTRLENILNQLQHRNCIDINQWTKDRDQCQLTNIWEN